jgi:hypothetical protein
MAITSTAVLPGLRGSEDVLGILLSAIDSGRAVQFPHRPSRSEPYTTRTVEPWGVLTDRGRWYLVGHDRDRDATRTFRLSRIGADVTPIGPPGAVKRPQGVNLREIVDRAVGDWPNTGQARVWVADGRATALRRRATVVGPLAGRPARRGDHRRHRHVDRLAREIAATGRTPSRSSYNPCATTCWPDFARRPAKTARSPHDRRLHPAGPAAQHGAVLPGQPKITYAEAASDLGVSVKQLRDDSQPAVDVRSARLRPW